MHPFYLHDYIKKLTKELQDNKDFLAQGLHSTYDRASKRDTVELQWIMAEIAADTQQLVDRLNQLDRELEKINANK